MAQYIQVDFTDTEGTAYKIEIHDESYTGVIYQVQGKAVLEYPKVKTMDMLRGSTLKIQLEASLTDTYYSRLIETVGDKKLPVFLYKDDVIMWSGFIKPDGIVESFVTDYWVINIQAIDGLGLLENIKFLKPDGTLYQGSISELELLARCLQLTGQSFKFRLYQMNLYYSVDGDAPLLANTALKTTYVNADRYKKQDVKESVFTVKEVLESILKKYGAFVTQQDNQWHIVRLIDYYEVLPGHPYELYDVDGVYENGFSVAMSNDLGSDIDDYDPFHAGGNQQKTYKVALGAYKVTYNYGVVASILENSNLLFNDILGDIDGWTLIEDIANMEFVPSNTKYIGKFYAVSDFPFPSVETVLEYDVINFPVSIDGGDILTVKFNSTLYVPDNMPHILTTAMKALVVFTSDSGTVLYLNNTGEWTLTVANISAFTDSSPINTGENEYNREIIANATEESGSISISFTTPVYKYDPFKNNLGGVYASINSVTINTNGLQAKGESHTAQRNLEGDGTATAVVDSTDKIYVGDNNSDLYVGAIEDSAGENTLVWSKAISGVIDESKQFRLLNWLARDRMTISSGNSTVFKGGIYGYLPYLGVLSINNVEGVFMTIAWKYDLASNKIEATHERIFKDDVYSDVSVFFQYESDNVIRPAIE